MNVLVFCNCYKQELVSYLERELFWAQNVKFLYEGFVNFWLLIVLVSHKPVSYKKKHLIKDVSKDRAFLQQGYKELQD